MLQVEEKGNSRVGLIVYKSFSFISDFYLMTIAIAVILLISLVDFVI